MQTLLRRGIAVSSISLVLALSFVIAASPQAQAAERVTYGPYVQRVDSKRATVILKTANQEKLKILYREQGQKWKTLTDKHSSTLHRYRLLGLKKNTTYDYFITTGSKQITQVYSFSTHHDVTDTKPLRIGVVGDSGVQNTHQLRVISQMQRWNPDILLHTGDIAYNSGTTDEFTTGFLQPFQALIAEVPLYGTIGNHEYTTAQAGPYKSILELPQENSGNEDYYSFDYGPAHIVSLNSNLDFSANSAMTTWLKADLKASKSKWKIVFFHHPVYSSGLHGSTEGMAESLVPLFEQHGVDLVLNGHDHSYERNKKTNGVLYVVTGGGAQTLYTQTSPNSFSEKFVSERHFVGLKIYPKKLQLEAIDKYGYVIDSYTLQ